METRRRVGLVRINVAENRFVTSIENEDPEKVVIQ